MNVLSVGKPLRNQFSQYIQNYIQGKNLLNLAMREILVSSISYLEILWRVHTEHDPYECQVANFFTLSHIPK